MGDNFGLGTALLYAVIGILTVFAVLFLLFVILTLFGKLFSAKKKAPADDLPAPPAKEPFTGCKLYGVDDKTAALVMAIVADKTGLPPERLCFEYIKPVEDDNQ